MTNKKIESVSAYYIHIPGDTDAPQNERIFFDMSDALTAATRIVEKLNLPCTIHPAILQIAKCIENHSSAKADKPKSAQERPALKLEVGKRYKNGNGDVSGPMERRGASRRAALLYPFACTDTGRTFTADGRYSIAGDNPLYNLIEEYIEPAPLPAPLKLEIGKRYKSRDGELYGPMIANKHSYYFPFRCDTTRITFTGNGEFLFDEPHHHPSDLIEEYND